MKPGHGSISGDARFQGIVPILLMNVAALTLLTPLFDWDRCSRRCDAGARWLRELGVAENLLPADPAGNVILVQPPISEFPAFPDGDSPENRLTVEVRWDPITRTSTFRVMRFPFTLDELKAWMFPIARSRIDPRTKFSKISVCVRARNAPFGEVRKVLDVCADKDIQIHKVYLALADPGR